MKSRSLFQHIIMTLIIATVCILLTVGASFLAGSLNVEIFDFEHLNFSNMIPVLLIGGFISCAVIGICVLFTVRTALFKAKDFLKNDTNKKTED